MAVVSLKLNRKEADMIDFLADYYEEDRPSLIKHSLTELYEDVKDKETIRDFESGEANNDVKYIEAAALSRLIKENRQPLPADFHS